MTMALFQSTDNCNNLLNNCDFLFNVMLGLYYDYYVIHSPLDKAN